MDPLNTLPSNTVVKLKQVVQIVFPIGRTDLQLNDTITINSQIMTYTAVVREDGGETLFINGAGVTDYEVMEEVKKP